MNRHGKFLGYLEINGNIERRILYVFMPEECLSICDVDSHERGKHHRELLFSPCTRGMLVTHSSDQLAGGRYFEISGTKIGTFYEGQSMPYGEEKFDCRPIQTIRLDLAYFADGIVLKISGTTLTGAKTTIPNSTHSEALLPWNFKIQFDIPRADFKEFFELNDLGAETLNQVYDQYAKIRA